MPSCVRRPRAGLWSKPPCADATISGGRDHLADIRWKYENCHRPYKLVHHVANLIQELERAGAPCKTSLPPVDTWRLAVFASSVFDQ
jgi:hypothetical protein